MVSCLIVRGRRKQAANIALRPKIREIENLASNVWAEGARYPENVQKMVGR